MLAQWEVGAAAEAVACRSAEVGTLAMQAAVVVGVEAMALTAAASSVEVRRMTPTPPAS